MRCLKIEDKINKLTILEFDGDKCICECECGNISKHFIKDLTRDDIRQVKSCGCILKEIIIQRNTTHGKSNSRLYHTYNHIKYRCYNKKCKNYKHYGARGIVMCDEWLNDFNSFYDWAISNGYNDTLTIDRIDVNGNYEPSNCRWVDMKTQGNNRRNNRYVTYKDKTMSLSNWCDLLGLDYNLINDRLLRGWSFDKAIHKPKRENKYVWYLGKKYTIHALTKKLEIPYNTFTYNFNKNGYDYIKKLGDQNEQNTKR